MIFASGKNRTEGELHTSFSLTDGDTVILSAGNGAEIRSVCTEAGMFAIRARRKAVTEEDFLKAIDKVIKGYQKFSSTSKYMVYNWGVCYSRSSLCACFECFAGAL